MSESEQDDGKGHVEQDRIKYYFYVQTTPLSRMIAVSKAVAKLKKQEKNDVRHGVKHCAKGHKGS